MQIEERIIRYIQTFSNDLLDNFFEIITMLGEEAFFVIVLSVLFWCTNKKFARQIICSVLFSGLINSFIKNLVLAARPIGIKGIRSLRIDTATGHSFPSGHTQSVATFLSSISIYYKKTWLSILSGIIIVLVALSRLYLGVHWPKDVIGGIVLGLLSAYIVNALFKALGEGKSLFVFSTIGVGAMLLVPRFADKDFAVSSGILTGASLGAYLEIIFIKHVPKKTLSKHIVKIVFGLSILFILKNGLKLILPEYLIWTSIRYLIVGVFATFLAPMIFKKCNL